MGISLILFVRCVEITYPFIADSTTMKKHYSARRSVARFRIVIFLIFEWVDLFSDSS